MLLEDKVVVVTGAAGNLGTATVRTFLHQGARVFAATRNADDFHSLQATMPNPEHLLGGVYDLSRTDEADRLLEQALEAHGSLHGVANLVGGWAGGQSIMETTDLTFDAMLALNLRTAWGVTRAAMQVLAEEGGGSLVNVGATWAHHMTETSGIGAYAVSKAAVIALTRAAAVEGRSLRVRANVVAPGSMLPKGARASDPANQKLVPPELVARSMAFLLSDGAAEITGTVVDLPGR
jgi:NAD(P)-dependent dehydrogenase (short-subunit alcohol dehydrogenase family)